MSETAAEETPTEGRVGFRDIYRAVGESEARIVAALNNAINPLALQAQDHEARLRLIEVQGSPEAREALARLAILEASVAPLALLQAARDEKTAAALELAQKIADTQRAWASKGVGIAATFTGAQKIIITIAAAGGIITLLIDLLMRLAKTA